MKAFSMSQNKIIDVPDAPKGWTPPKETPVAKIQQPTTQPQQPGAMGMPGQQALPGRVLYAKGSQAVVIGKDGKPSTIDSTQQNPLSAAYNLTLRPIVEGVKAYGSLLATAAGTVGLAALNEADPNSKNPMLTNMKNSLVSILTPMVTAKYTEQQGGWGRFFSGLLDTVQGEGAALQGAFGLEYGVAKLALTNLAYNAAFYSTGEGIKLLEGKQGNMVSGALGFTNDGIFVSAAGDNPTTRAMDNIIQLAAPILMGQIKNRISESGVLTKLPDRTKGSLATSVAGFPDKTSVVNSEKLMGKMLQITHSDNVREMAREMDPKNPQGIIATTNNVVDKYLPELDKSIGQQPRQAVLDLVKTRLAQTAEGQNYPQVIKRIASRLEGLLKTDNLGDGTSLSKMNEARKLLTKTIPDSWWSSARTDNASNVQHWMEWQAANYMKDIIAQADTTGFLQSSLDAQHAAYAVTPHLSEQVARTSFTYLSHHPMVLALTMIQKLYGTFTNPLKVYLAREAQGRPALDVTQQPDVPQTEKGVLPILQEFMAKQGADKTQAPEPPEMRNLTPEEKQAQRFMSRTGTKFKLEGSQGVDPQTGLPIGGTLKRSNDQ